MIFFKDFRKKLSSKILKADLKRKRLKHSTRNFQDSKKIGVLFSIHNMVDLEIVKKFIEELEDNNKKVMNLGYVAIGGFEKNQSHVFPELDFYYAKDLSLLFKPSGRKVYRFIKTEFDLMISLNYNNNFSVDYIAAQSHAIFRVGPYHKDRLLAYDFMIDNPNKDINYLIEQAKHYLSILKHN